MAMIYCRECGRPVSTEARACPNCGAPPLMTKNRVKTGGTVLRVLGVALALIFMLAMCSHIDSNQSESRNTSVPKQQVDYARPLQTQKGALVCPFSAAFDNREGHGLLAAMKSRYEIIDRREDAEKAGCSEWKQGLAISLSNSALDQAQHWQTEGTCGMLEFSNGFVFSCDLENSERSAIGIPERTGKNVSAESDKAKAEIESFNNEANEIYLNASAEDKKYIEYFKTENEWVSPGYFCGSSGCDETAEEYEKKLEAHGWRFVYARDRKGSTITNNDDAFYYGRWVK